MKKINPRKTKASETRDYDESETLGWVDQDKRLKFEDLGLRLPDVPPTQVISIRLPSNLINELKAYGSQRDIPYQALIKLLLAESLGRLKKNAA